MIGCLVCTFIAALLSFDHLGLQEPRKSQRHVHLTCGPAESRAEQNASGTCRKMEKYARDVFWQAVPRSLAPSAAAGTRRVASQSRIKSRPFLARSSADRRIFRAEMRMGRTILPHILHFLEHDLADFGRGIDGVPGDVLEVEGVPRDVLDRGKGAPVRPGSACVKS